MKRTRMWYGIIMTLCVCILLFSFFPAAGSESNHAQSREVHASKSVAYFPASLQTLENEAFSGTSLSVLIFYSGLSHIEDMAFSDAADSIDAYIPESAVYIAVNAFPKGAVIHGLSDSYAQEWAQKNNYRFVVEDIWNVWAVSELVHLIMLILLCAILPPDMRIMGCTRRRIECFIKSMRPQDRPELYPIDYRFP